MNEFLYLRSGVITISIGEVLFAFCIPGRAAGLEHFGVSDRRHWLRESSVSCFFLQRNFRGAKGD